MMVKRLSSRDEAAQEVLPERRALMSFDITDHVDGLSDEQVAAAVDEAEAGYDLEGTSPEPNPHLQKVQLVHADLVEAIEERAHKDGQTPEDVLREALVTYLHIA
jgi:hypothetical protein